MKIWTHNRILAGEMSVCLLFTPGRDTGGFIQGEAMPEEIYLNKVQETQAFDALLRAGKAIDRIASQFLINVLFEPNQIVRQRVIGELQTRVYRHFQDTIQPTAKRIGTAQARRIIADIGGELPVADINDAEFRRRVLIDSELRPRDRLRIVQTIVNDKANTLDNRLAAYWLEPGRNPKEKVEQLRKLHMEMEGRRRAYDQGLLDYSAGKINTPPRRPQLDYYAKFTADVKQGVREQGRRTATDAEHSTFQVAGFREFTWVTVNAGDACPDCRKRQGITGTMESFERGIGTPGSGGTVCGAACFCLLVPAQTVKKYPSLDRGLSVNPRGGQPQTRAAQAQLSK